MCKRIFKVKNEALTYKIVKALPLLYYCNGMLENGYKEKLDRIFILY